MKKILFSAFLSAGVWVAQAQETQEITFKPKAHDFGLEVVFNPLAGVALHSQNSPFSSYALTNFTAQYPWLKARYFVSDLVAFRAGLRIGVQNTSDPGLLQNGVTLSDHTTGVFSLALLPGFEKHFKGTERLSPYVGAELAIGIVSATATDETAQGGFSVKYEASGSTSTYNNSSSNGTRSSVSFGLNALAGSDYYFIKRAYLGIEMGFGLNYVSYSEVKITISNSNNSDQTNTVLPGSSAISIIPSAVGALRLGFWF